MVSPVALGRASDAEQCTAFERQTVQDQPLSGFTVDRITVGPDNRCYVEVNVSTARGRLWRIVIDDGAAGIDVARCTLNDRASSLACTDPLDTLVTYSAYKRVREMIFNGSN